MDASVDSIDDSIGFAGQFVVQPFPDEATRDLGSVLRAMDHIVRYRPIDPFLRERSVHDGDGCPAAPEVAQSLLGLLGDDPAGSAVRRRQPPSSQPLQPPDHQPAQFRVSRVFGRRS